MQTRRTRSKAAIAHWSCVLQPLVDSGFLGAAQVGQLAQTCQKLNEACLQDEIWASFCQREYPVTRYLSQKTNQFKGYRLLYKSWSAPIVKRRPPALTLGFPSCVSTQLCIAINIKHKGTPISSMMFNLGKSLSPFIEHGGVKINFPSRKIVLGKAEFAFSEEELLAYQRGGARGVAQQGLTVQCKDFDPSNLDVRIHLYRSSDQAMACLFSSQHCSSIRGLARVRAHPENVENITLQSKFDLTRDQKTFFLSYKQPTDTEAIQGWPLKHTHQASLIMEALNQAPLYLEPHLGLGVIEGDQFAITKIVLHSMIKDSDSPLPRRFKSKQETKQHGVTLLHVLSELQGT